MKHILALAFFCSTLLSACSSTPVVPSKTTSSTSTTVPTSNVAQVTANQSGNPTGSALERQRFERFAKQLAANSIYFDLDQATVQAKYKSLLLQNYNALKENPNQKVWISGNTDERGTSEYNLALAQRRAEAVKNALKLLGVSEAQMEAVSYGEEKPRATCHNESCWAENRRVDFAAK